MLSEELMRSARLLEIRTRRRVDNLFAGEYHAAFRGQGLEFAEVREYEPGDDVRSIDWNVTARTGRPFIKRFTEERQQTVVLAVDATASQRAGTRGKLKTALAAECAAVLSVAASRNGDRVALLLYGGDFGPTGELFVPPGRGRRHTQRIIRDILAHRPKGTGPGTADVASSLVRVLHRRSVVFLISDFLDLATETSNDHSLRRLARDHELVAVRTQDTSERELPALGLVRFADPESGSGRFAMLTGRRARRYADCSRAGHESAARRLRRAGADLIELSTERPLIDDLARAFHRRERAR